MADEQGNQSSRFKKDLEWMWRTFRDHPIKTILLGAIGSLVASLVLFSLGSAPWQDDETGARIGAFESRIDGLQHDLEEMQRNSGETFRQMDSEYRELARRVTDVEGQEFDILLIEQRLGMTLPDLRTGTADLNNRVLRLETGSADGRDLQGLERHFDGTLDGIRSDLGGVERQAEQLERAMERLRGLHHDAHNPLASESEVETLRRQIDDLSADIQRYERDASASVNSLYDRVEALEEKSSPVAAPALPAPIPNPAEQGKATMPAFEPPTSGARGEFPAPVPALSEADPSQACDLPIDPLLRGKAVQRPEIKRSRKPLQPSHPPVLREFQVDVCLTIAEDGTVREAQVLGGEGIHPAFLSASEDAGRRWRFQPASWRGQAVEWRMKVGFRFDP